MSDKGCAQVAAAGLEPPFVLLAGCDAKLLKPEALAPAMRRMGLEPEVPVTPDVGSDLIENPLLEIRFAAQRALAGRAAVGRNVAASCAGFDPTSTLACVPTDTTVGDRVSSSRELFKLAVLLIDLMGAERIYWSPAQLWSDAQEFRTAVTEMLASGLPPVLHLVAFDTVGAVGGLRSRGLAHFSGQEIELTAAEGLDARELMRRAARLAIDIMINGPIHAPRTFPGLAAGEQIRVSPAAGDAVPGTLRVTVTLA